MAESIWLAKAALRKSISAILRNLPSTSIQLQSEKAIAILMQLQRYNNARRISIYLSMPGTEIQTRTLVLHALENGKKVFVPYITRWEPMRMLGLRGREDYDSLKGDRWGIPSLPKEGLEEREDASEGEGLDLVVVPGMAFDRDCRRLGHGKGYYDRFLAEYKAKLSDNGEARMPYLVGLALQEQILSADVQVPTTPDDWLLDAVITGDGVLLQR